MKNMKKVLGLSLAGTMVMAAMTGCGGSAAKAPAEPAASSAISEAPEETGTETADQVIYMITGQTTEYISMLVDEATAAAEEAGYELKVSDAAADWSKEMTLIETAQNDNAEAIIIIPSASDDVETILDAAEDTKVVFLNRELTDVSALDETHVYIGPDENYSGVYQGELLADCLNKAGKTEVNALILTGPDKLQHSIKRTAGVKDTLAAAGINATYIEMNCQESTDVAVDEIKAAYEGKEVDFDVIISENDAMACGAITAFEELELDISGIPVVGIDATSDAVYNIKEGKMYGTIYQDAVQAKLAVKACINLLEGKAYNDGLDGETSADNANVTLTGWEKVTADNVDFFK